MYIVVYYPLMVLILFRPTSKMKRREQETLDTTETVSIYGASTFITSGNSLPFQTLPNHPYSQFLVAVGYPLVILVCCMISLTTFFQGAQSCAPRLEKETSLCLWYAPIYRPLLFAHLTPSFVFPIALYCHPTDGVMSSPSVRVSTFLSFQFTHRHLLPYSLMSS